MARSPQLGNASRDPVSALGASIELSRPPTRSNRALKKVALTGSLLATCLWPAASNAAVGNTVNFFYTHQQNVGVALPAPPGQDWWLKGTATQTAAGIDFKFTTASSGNTSQFFNDFVFNVNPLALTSVAITCAGNADASCEGATNTTGAAAGTYDPNGGIKFIATSGWELELRNAPPPGGNDNFLNEVATTNLDGETIMFSVTGLTVAQLTANTDTPEGYFSCTHHQGLGNNTQGSSRLCAKLENDPGPGNEVPGPLPILGAAAAFGYSRKLRRKLKAKPEIQ